MYICNIIIFALLWQGAIQNYTNFRYVDEVIALFFGLFLLWNAMKGQKISLYKSEKKALYCTVAFFIIGCLSVIVFNYQNDFFYGFISGIFSCKSFIAYFGARIFFQKYTMDEKNLKRMLKFIEWSMIFSMFLLIYDQFIPIFQHSNQRFGLSPSYYFFEHPTELSCYGVVSLILSIYLRDYLGYKKRIYMNYIPAIVIVLISARYKAIAFICFFVLMRMFLPYMRKLKLSKMIMAVPVVLLVTYKQIIRYFTDITSSRGALYYNSFLIARDHFPLGSGFATYGTEYSRSRYSPIYYEYGVYRVYGLTPLHPAFITDTMWAGIIGEAGVFGTLCVIMFFIFLYITLYKEIKNKYMLLTVLGIVIYGLFESIADATFMTYRGVLIFIIVAFMLELNCRKKSMVDNNN